MEDLIGESRMKDRAGCLRMRFAFRRKIRMRRPTRPYRKSRAIQAVSGVLLSAYCLAGAEIAAADSHGIVIKLEFSGRNGQSGAADGGSGEQAGNGSGAFRGIKLEIAVPSSESNQAGNAESDRKSSGGTVGNRPARTGEAKGAASGDAVFPEGRRAGASSENREKPKMEGERSRSGGYGDKDEFDLGDPQADAAKNLDEIQKDADQELDRSNKILEKSLKSLDDIKGARRGGSRPSSDSPPCTPVSGNAGATHEFIDGIKECECDGEACHWK